MLTASRSRNSTVVFKYDIRLMHEKTGSLKYSSYTVTSCNTCTTDDLTERALIPFSGK